MRYKRRGLSSTLGYSRFPGLFTSSSVGPAVFLMRRAGHWYDSKDVSSGVVASLPNRGTV